MTDKFADKSVQTHTRTDLYGAAVERRERRAAPQPRRTNPYYLVEAISALTLHHSHSRVVPLSSDKTTPSSLDTPSYHHNHSTSYDKSASDSQLNELSESTESTFVSQRFKRAREDETATELDNFKEEIKALLSSFMATQKTELEKITCSIKEIQQSNHNIDNSIAILTSQNEEFRSKIETMELQIKKDREYITLLEEKVEDMQRDSRKSNIELKNVPATEKESKEELLTMILHLSKHIDCKVEKSDIRDIYRVRTRTRNGELVKNPPIIMELGSSILKRDILGKTKLFNTKNKQKLHAKHLGFTTNEDTPVFVTEQLTPKGARLFFLARDLSKSKSYKVLLDVLWSELCKKGEKMSYNRNKK
ncbi:unnamed protein product [Chilo suppressalis]|uniref:Uncharacterized protein n=1 Tax=Chilo suppressalis TaxID=168631 RepID=A0ABN8B8D7_CHISP|nr:unnamed protein product [Chilo suppressalis]